MQTQRSTFETVWRDIEERINPTDTQFQSGTTPQEPGKQNNQKVFDATPGLALDRFKAALHSLICPRAQTWHKIKPVSDELKEDTEVLRYLDEVNERIFSARYSANFDSEAQMCFGNGGKYGSFSMFVGERQGRGLYYRAVPMKQLFFAENQYGEIDLVHRDFWMTAREAYQRFGDKLPRVIKECAERNPGQKFRFLHVVKPREDADIRRSDAKGMAFASFYVSFETAEVIEEGGFRTFPYPSARYDLSPGEVYGRSPCMTILPDVKMLNQMNKTVMKAAELQTLPPMLAAEDGSLDSLRLIPGAINHGAVDDQGRALVQPLNLGGDIRLGEYVMDQKRQIVNDALLQTLFQILVDKPNITATEAMLRAQEKGQLIGPTGARIEAEFLTVMIRRELDIMAAAGQLPEMPKKLADAGGMYAIEYDSPLSRMRESEGGVAILRTFEQLTPLAQIAGPDVFKRFNVDAAAKELARLNGVPAKILYSDEEMEQLDQQGQQQAELETLLQAAPVAASAAKDIAQAQSLAAAVPNQALPNVMGA